MDNKRIERCEATRIAPPTQPPDAASLGLAERVEHSGLLPPSCDAFLRSSSSSKRWPRSAAMYEDVEIDEVDENEFNFESSKNESLDSFKQEIEMQNKHGDGKE